MTAGMQNTELSNVPTLKQDLFVSDKRMKIQVLNSQQQTELYHFKVM